MQILRFYLGQNWPLVKCLSLILIWLIRDYSFDNCISTSQSVSKRVEYYFVPGFPNTDKLLILDFKNLLCLYVQSIPSGHSWFFYFESTIFCDVQSTFFWNFNIKSMLNVEILTSKYSYVFQHFFDIKILTLIQCWIKLTSKLPSGLTVKKKKKTKGQSIAQHDQNWWLFEKCLACPSTLLVIMVWSSYGIMKF